MVPIVKSLSAAATTSALPLDHFRNPFNVAIAVALSNTPTLTYSVEYTLDDPAMATTSAGAGLTWFSHATLAGQTASAVGNIAFPVRAVRLNVTSYTAGTATITVIQAGP